MLKQFFSTHRKTIKKILNAGLLLGIIFVLSIFSTSWTAPTIIVIQDEFLMNFIGIILGLAITLLTFIYSSFDKIYSAFAKQKDEIRKNIIQAILKNAFKELVQDTYFVMVIFGIFTSIIVLKNTDIPLISWTLKTISKDNIVNFGKYFCFFAVCISIFDMVITLFKMMNTIDFDNDK